MMHLRKPRAVDLLPLRRPPPLLAVASFFAPTTDLLNLGPSLHLVRVEVVLEVLRQFSLLKCGEYERESSKRFG